MTLADPFGFPMEDRAYGSGSYRYGFNGQEKDNEIYGEGQSYTAEFWQYDARLGRRWNVDPVRYPSLSSYGTFANNPIRFSDVLGLDTSFTDNQARQDFMTAYNNTNKNIERLEGELQGYQDQLSNDVLKRGEQRRLEKNISNLEESLGEWNKLKIDFESIINSVVVFKYSSNI